MLTATSARCRSRLPASGSEYSAGPSAGNRAPDGAGGRRAGSGCGAGTSCHRGESTPDASDFCFFCFFCFGLRLPLPRLRLGLRLRLRLQLLPFRPSW